MVFGTDGVTQIISFLLFFALIFLYPRIMISQMVAKIQREVDALKGMTQDSMKATAKAMGGPVSENKKRLKRMIEFFVISPESTDPSGIMPKLDKIMREVRGSFTEFVETSTKIKDPAQIKNIETMVSQTAGNHQIAKILNHFLGLVKKYKNLQIAMIVNMQLPMIKEFAKAINNSVKTTLEGAPWGDSAGPLVAAELMGRSKAKKIKGADMVYSEVSISGRKCIVTKADGPGSTVGYPSDGLKYLIKKYKPARIISVDAAGKMEGEETGSLAEGVGMVMGPPQGPGVDRYFIEEAALKNNIPMHGIAIKMGMEQSMTWMPSEVYKAVPKAIEYVKDAVRRVPKGKKVVIIGVGNTIGIPNGGDLREVDRMIKENAKKHKEEKEKMKKGLFGKRPTTTVKPQTAGSE